MPNGRVMRIDPKRQCVYVVRRGRSYEAPLSEVDAAARVPGARVEYRLQRAKGVETAAQVRLRTGTRTSRSQRRFGDLTGARRPGTNVPTSGQRAYGIDVATQPFRVVRAWLEALEADDYDAATSLYLPSAVLHDEAGSVSGRLAIRARMESCAWVGVDSAAVELHGEDLFVRAETDQDGQAATTYFVIEQGHIIEHWLDIAPDLGPDLPSEEILQVVTIGDIDAADQDYAGRRLEHFIEALDPAPSFARVKLRRESNPTNERPARVESTIDLDGPVIRVHAQASTMTEAVDLAVDRLNDKLEHHRDRERHRASGLAPLDGQWRQGNLPTVHPPYFERDVEDREVVRHKSFAPDEMSVDEALWDMALLDYEFFLFVELSSGCDCLLVRGEDGGTELHVIGSSGDRAELGTDDVPSSEEIPPTLKPSEAIEFLDTSRLPFVFFDNAISHRGNVVYRRYDGHYGLITTPVDE